MNIAPIAGIIDGLCGLIKAVSPLLSAVDRKRLSEKLLRLSQDAISLSSSIDKDRKKAEERENAVAGKK